MMMRFAKFLILPVFAALAACSGEQSEVGNDYVLKEQTAAIDKAREVENTLRDAAKLRQGTD